jgi:cytochrome c peroxidase
MWHTLGVVGWIQARRAESTKRWRRATVLLSFLSLTQGSVAGWIKVHRAESTKHWHSTALLLQFLALAACSIARANPPALEALPPPAQIQPALVELGRHLFFEPRLSGDGSRSCASCHVPELGFADGLALARGYNGTEYFRNAPSLLSVRLKRRLTWDGRLDGGDLATAVRDMVTEAHFMNADARLLQERVRQIPGLMVLWRKALGPSSEPYGPQIFNAIAEYLKTLDAPDTALDRHLRGEPVRLPPMVQEGLALFHGKAACNRCHSGPLGSDGKAHRLGLSEHPAVLAEPQRSISLLRHHATMGVPNYMHERKDLGAYVLSKTELDRGRFHTPSLRMLVHTGPYMHNGLLATLEEVVAFYDAGGGPGGDLAPLHLSARERAALLALLRAWSAPLPLVAAPPAYDYAVLPAGQR